MSEIPFHLDAFDIVLESLVALLSFLHFASFLLLINVFNIFFLLLNLSVCSRGGLIQKASAGGGGRRSGGLGRMLQRSAHLAAGESDAPAASCSGVSSRCSTVYLPSTKFTNFVWIGDNVVEKKVKSYFLVDKSEILKQRRGVSFCGVPWCAGHCRLRPCCFGSLQMFIGGTLMNCPLTSLAPLSHFQLMTGGRGCLVN